VKVLDRIFGWLLVFGSLGHGAGSFVAFKASPEMLVMSLSGTMSGLLLAATNLLRVERPEDRALAWICLAGCVGSLALTAMFADALKTIFDYRVMIQMVLQLFLLVFSIETLARQRKA
jgi:hypothetical protein